MIWSFYNHIIHSEKYGYFLYNGMSGVFLHVEEEDIGSFYELQKNPDSYVNYENADFLLEQQIVVVESKDKDNLANHINEVLRRRYDTSVMNLTIAVTRDCNFNCVYCYETERPHIYMNEGVEDSIVSFLRSNKQLRALNVVWYGGEPLMNFSTIKRLTDKFKSLNIEYTAEIVTNGYLMNEEICKSFKHLSINKVQVTLDGFPHVHDKRRILRSGKGTYDVIFNNIINLLKYHSGVKINLRSNVDVDNADSYADFCNYINDYFKDERISSYPGFVEDLLNSGCSASARNISEHKSKVDFLISNYKEKGVFSDFLPQRQYQTCIANNLSCFLIDPYGDIYKCWIAMSDSKYRIGNVLHIGDFDDTMNARFLCGNDYLFDTKCRECSLLPICDGGCPMRRIVGLYDKKEKNVCYSHKKESLTSFLEAYYELLLRSEDNN